MVYTSVKTLLKLPRYNNSIVSSFLSQRKKSTGIEIFESYIKRSFNDRIMKLISSVFFTDKHVHIS